MLPGHVRASRSERRSVSLALMAHHNKPAMSSFCSAPSWGLPIIFYGLLQSSFTVYNTSIDVYINTSPIKDNIGTVWYSIYTFLKIKILLSQCLHNLSQNGLMPADGHRNQHAALAQHSVHLADGCLHFLWTNKWIVHIHIVKWHARSIGIGINRYCSTNIFFSEPRLTVSDVMRKN